MINPGLDVELLNLEINNTYYKIKSVTGYVLIKYKQVRKG